MHKSKQSESGSVPWLQQCIIMENGVSSSMKSSHTYQRAIQRSSNIH